MSGSEPLPFSPGECMFELQAKLPVFPRAVTGTGPVSLPGRSAACAPSAASPSTFGSGMAGQLDSSGAAGSTWSCSCSTGGSACRQRRRRRRRTAVTSHQGTSTGSWKPRLSRPRRRPPMNWPMTSQPTAGRFLAPERCAAAAGSVRTRLRGSARPQFRQPRAASISAETPAGRGCMRLRGNALGRGCGVGASRASSPCCQLVSVHWGASDGVSGLHDGAGLEPGVRH